MRIVFMGTPDIAVAALEQLLKNSHEVVAVYTRPDKPVGRKQVMTAPPVKICAEKNGIPVYQPTTLRNAEAAATLDALQPDIVVVVAYGMLLPAAVLAVPPLGCINLHVSLLPQYRGAAPIQWAVIHGEKETGVSIMQLDEGLDTGPVYTTRKVEIPPDATSGEVFELVTAVGADLLEKTIQEIGKGKATPVPQQGEPSYAPQINKTHAQMEFASSAKILHNLVRGCNPWPLAWFMHQGKRIKVTQAACVEGKGIPGEILALNPLTVACGEDALELHTVVPEGSRAMSGAEWAAGRRFKIKDVI